MEEHQTESSVFRILKIYDLITRGETLIKKQLALEFDVSEKTIQRDIAKIKYYLETVHVGSTVLYDRETHGHRLNREGISRLTDRDIFAVCKVLLDARAFSKEEMNQILEHLLKCAFDQKIIEKYIGNEKNQYVPIKHGKALIDKIWFFRKCIENQMVMNVEYEKQDGSVKTHKINPLGILFNEYYFYLIAEINGVDNPISLVFRLDRFINYAQEGKQRFHVNYGRRFKEGEFRKRIQFMYTGELTTVCFNFSGASVEAVLDRLPTAEIIKKENGIFTIKAEVYGAGVKKWLLSQGDWVEVLSPKSYRQEMIEMIDKMRKKYKN